MTSTARLTLAGSGRRAQHRQSIDPIVGDSRPGAVRALLARSITMTAHELERRIRIRRRQPSTEALRLVSTASSRSTGGRAERHVQDARAGVVRSAVVLR